MGHERIARPRTAPPLPPPPATTDSSTIFAPRTPTTTRCLHPGHVTYSGFHMSNSGRHGKCIATSRTYRAPGDRNGGEDQTRTPSTATCAVSGAGGAGEESSSATPASSTSYLHSDMHMTNRAPIRAMHSRMRASACANNAWGTYRTRIRALGARTPRSRPRRTPRGSPHPPAPAAAASRLSARTARRPLARGRRRLPHTQGTRMSQCPLPPTFGNRHTSRKRPVQAEAAVDRGERGRRRGREPRATIQRCRLHAQHPRRAACVQERARARPQYIVTTHRAKTHAASPPPPPPPSPPPQPPRT